MNSEFLRTVYDTKVLTLYAGHIPKSDLQSLFTKISKDKKYTNNLGYEPDEENSKQPRFSAYKAGGQGHDAGYDAFMTGVVFASLSKFIEIGNVVNKYKTHNPETLLSPIGNKRQIKAQRKNDE